MAGTDAETTGMVDSEKPAAPASTADKAEAPPSPVIDSSLESAPVPDLVVAPDAAAVTPEVAPPVSEAPAVPEIHPAPEALASPVIPSAPEVLTAPESASSPESVPVPELVVTPDGATVRPEVTPAPEALSSPAVPSAPEVLTTPEDTSSPESVPALELAVVPDAATVTSDAPPVPDVPLAPEIAASPAAPSEAGDATSETQTGSALELPAPDPTAAGAPAPESVPDVTPEVTVDVPELAPSVPDASTAPTVDAPELAAAPLLVPELPRLGPEENAAPGARDEPSGSKEPPIEGGGTSESTAMDVDGTSLNVTDGLGASVSITDDSFLRLTTDGTEIGTTSTAAAPSSGSSAAGVGSASLVKGSARQVQGRAVLWRKILLSRDQGDPNELKPFSSWKVELDEPNQRVIRADVERTRADQEYFRQTEVRKKMEEMLTCWCKLQSVRYKQGLNEVLAPFLHLQTEPADAAPSDDEVFTMFSMFLRRFAPFFDSDDFVPLQCAFIFFKRLLLYHHPNLHNYLFERDIHPEMFCTPWFLTIFASKTPLRIALQLWDRHLQRNEPSFFVFLAVAVLANSQQAVFAADRSGLPEVLTHLGLSSREELEQLWSLAETLHRTTPATFVARLRRNVLGIRTSRQAKAEKGNADPDMEAATAERLLEKLEQERCFFILPEEVVGHCYPLRAGEAPRPWHPSPLCSWRLLVLDLRSNSEYDAGRLPTGLRFNVKALLQGAGQGPVAAARRLLPWTTDAAAEELEPSTVFEGLKELLGEDWVCNNEAHICLLGSSDTEGSTAVKSLYDLMTMQLSLRHVSVASGGYEAVAACAQKQGFETICVEAVGKGTPRASASSAQAPGQSAPQAGSSLANAEQGDVPGGGADDESGNPSNLQAMEGADSGRWGMKFAASAWAGLKGAAAGAGKIAEGIGHGGDGQGPGEQGPLVTAGVPVLRDRPGNWPLDLDLMSLPMRPRKGLFAPGTYWPCMAVVVRCNTQHDGTATATDTPWEGCRCVLAFVGDPPATRIVCASAVSQENAAMLADFEVGQVLRVTSKKHAPDSLIFYFREGSLGISDPAVVLHFNNGAEDVRAFIKALKGKYI